MSNPPVPYAEGTGDTFGQDFASSCTAVPMRRGVRLKGRCPRCGDQMEFPIITEVFQTGATPAATVSEAEPVLCTCQVGHPGRPAGEEGCGAYWNVTLSGPAA